MQVVQVLKPIGPETRGDARKTTASVQEVAGGTYVVAKSYNDEISSCKVPANMDIDKFSEVHGTHMYFCLGESNQTSEYRCRSILLDVVITLALWRRT